ncbi:MULTISPECIES: hypothetical protein [unclassified Streptomyces]|uniref:hypothetical protein n=1 Tax=unclassified Streptomyces TaxID=2593676 RepID=UPI002E0FD4E0|nr:hypothetical protein OG725_20385 [Streptomyces sp. NBC_01213]WSQ86691.1 hypothetical protein OG722_21060 [Streptomyces sp. NBC_01212]
MSDMLFHRLDAEEHAARELVARLRAEITEAEERLTALAITRRTAAQLLEEAPPGKPTASGGSAEGRDGAHTQSSTNGASEATESDAESAPGERRGADKQHGSKHSGRLTELNRKVVTLVGSTDRPMSPKDVVIPLVDESAPRAEIERMRHRLNRLVNKGYLKQVGPGLYTGAEVDR